MAATPTGASAAPTGKPSPPPLDGELRFDEEARATTADDFGHIVHKASWGVLLPGSHRDVVTTIRWAGSLGHRIAPQGQSHSVYGRSQVQAGIVINMSRLRIVHAVQDDRVVVDAGAKWSEVLVATLPQGLTPPTLTDYLLSPFRRQAVTSPLLRLPPDDLVYAFNLVRIPTTNAAAEANRLVQANRAIYERVRAGGGTLYPVSAFPMSPDDWREHFGPAWGRLREAKDNFGPGHVLTPGYEVF